MIPGDKEIKDEIDVLSEINSELNANHCGEEDSAGLTKIVDCRFEAKLGLDLLKLCSRTRINDQQIVKTSWLLI